MAYFHVIASYALQLLLKKCHNDGNIMSDFTDFNLRSLDPEGNAVLLDLAFQ